MNNNKTLLLASSVLMISSGMAQASSTIDGSVQTAFDLMGTATNTASVDSSPAAMVVINASSLRGSNVADGASVNLSTTVNDMDNMATAASGSATLNLATISDTDIGGTGDVTLSSSSATGLTNSASGASAIATMNIAYIDDTTIDGLVDITASLDTGSNSATAANSIAEVHYGAILNSPVSASGSYTATLSASSIDNRSESAGSTAEVLIGSVK